MLTFFNKRLRNREGFTLIELIVVIGIIGILAAIAVPRLGGFTSDAQESANAGTARTIKSAVTMVEANTGSTFDTTVGTRTDLADLNGFLDLSPDVVAGSAQSTTADQWTVTTDGTTVYPPTNLTTHTGATTSY